MGKLVVALMERDAALLPCLFSGVLHRRCFADDA